jgi:YHS domain-containing protein
VRFIVWLLLGYLVYRMLRGRRAPEVAREKAATETFQDPVCGVYVSEADAVIGTLAGKRHHFCSLKCLQQFEKIQQKR